MFLFFLWNQQTRIFQRIVTIWRFGKRLFSFLCFILRFLYKPFFVSSRVFILFWASLFCFKLSKIWIMICRAPWILPRILVLPKSSIKKQNYLEVFFHLHQVFVPIFLQLQYGDLHLRQKINNNWQKSGNQCGVEFFLRQ